MHIDNFKQHFSAVEDNRQSSKIIYCLFEVLFGSLCAVIVNASGWADIREYILGHHDWFKRNGMFTKGIPREDTLSRIDPQAFHQCVIDWMSSVHTLTESQVIAIDGKALRGSYNREDRNSTIHMISAYASEAKLVLGQMKTSEKSNEITAIPEVISASATTR